MMMNKKNIIITLLLTSTILSFSMDGWARSLGVKTESEEIEEELALKGDLQEIAVDQIDDIAFSKEDDFIKDALKSKELKLFRNGDEYFLYDKKARQFMKSGLNITSLKSTGQGTTYLDRNVTTPKSSTAGASGVGVSADSFAAQLIAPNPPSSSSLSAGDAESSQPLAQVQVQAGTDAVSSSVKSSAVYPITTSSIATAAPVSEAASVTPASPQISQVTSASGAAVQMGEAVVVVHDDPGVSKAGLPRLMSKDELEKIENIEIANRIKDQMSNEPALQAWDFGNGRIVLRNAKSGSSYEVQSKASSHTQGNQVGRFTVSEAHPSTTTPAVQPKAKNKLESTMQEKTKIIQSGRASLSQSGVSKPKKKSEEN
jgi:hypothetical protein